MLRLRRLWPLALLPLACSHTPPRAPAASAPTTGTTAVTTAPVAVIAPAPIDEPISDPVDTTFGATPAEPAPDAAPVAGDTAGDSFGAGGLGLAGVGEGGAGRGEGIGLGSVGTIGHGAGTGSAPGVGSGAGTGFGSGHGRLGGSHKSKPPSVRMGAVSIEGESAGDSAPASAGAGMAEVAPRSPGEARQQQPASVQAGEWDDNANFREFSRWLASESAPRTAKLDLSVRRWVVVRDADGKPVPSCAVDVADAQGARPALTLTTTSSGRALLFPRAEGMDSADLVATARCQGLVAVQQAKVTPGDGVIDIRLPTARVLPELPTVDVAFVLDTTGSMSEEIGALRSTLEAVAAQLAELHIRPRAGLVEYRDRGDRYVTRLHQMTTDLPALSQRISAVTAQGGGDTPEHVNEALRVAVRGLHFRSDSLARLVFLVGDAPPHLDYEGDEGYAPAMKEASHAGVQIYTIAASGMDRVGQVVWRQIAEYTGATNMFVLRGGAGPASTGGGDPLTSCGGSRTDYTSGNLEALILSKVKGAIAATRADPMRIAGLGRDEKDLPCDQRVSVAQ